MVGQVAQFSENSNISHIQAHIFCYLKRTLDLKLVLDCQRTKSLDFVG